MTDRDTAALVKQALYWVAPDAEDLDIDPDATLGD